MVIPLLASIIGCALSIPNTPFSDIAFQFNVKTGASGLSGENYDSEELPIFCEEKIFESIPGKTGHHCATITAFDDGELLAAWYSYEGPGELSGSAIYMSRKYPDDDNWSKPTLIAKHSEKDGNPVLYSEGDRVWLFQAVTPFGWDTAHIIMKFSEDRGHSWSDDIDISKIYGLNVKYPPVRVANGKLLLGAYDEISDRSVFFASDDGNHWDFLSAIESKPGNIQPSIVKLQNDRLLAVMRNVKGGWLWVSASDDNGKHWSPPKNSGFPNPGSAAEIYRLENGHLILIYNDSNTARRPLTIALSEDEGQSWLYKKNIAQGEQKYSYPSCIQTPDKLIHIVYTHNRDSIHHVTLNERWIVSSN